MEFLQFFSLILILCFFTIGKIVTQRRCARLHVQTTVDSFRMIALFFLFTSLAFLPLLLFSSPSPEVLLWAIPAALLNLSFQVSYTLALSCGPAGITVLLSNLSMILPVLGATVFLGESFGTYRILGLILTVAALFLNTDLRKQDKARPPRAWVIYMTLTFFSNALASFWQKLFAKGQYGTEVASYGFFSYALAAAMAAIFLLLLRKNGVRAKAPISRSLVGLTALVGPFLGFFQYFFTYSQRVLDASLLLPIYNGATTVLMMLVSVLFYKEKLTRKRLASAIVGVMAIALFGITR